MLSGFESKQVVGKYFTGNKMSFHPTRLEIFLPINNNVLWIDLERNKSELLPFSARSKVTTVTCCNNGEIFVITDSENRVYIYNFLNKQLIGSKNFKFVISDVVFAHNNNFFVVAASRYLFFYEKPSADSGILLEPLTLIKKYNTKCVDFLSCVRFTKDDHFVIYTGDDNVIRLIPTFKLPQQNKNFELLGHKHRVTDIRESLLEDDHLISFDMGGLFLVWKLVSDQSPSTSKLEGGSKKIKTDQKLDEISSKMTLEDEKVTQNETKDFSALEKKLEGSKFILLAKHVIYQEGVQIKYYKFFKNLLLLAFSNSTFSLYTISPLETETFNVLLTFKINESFAQSLCFHNHQSVICIANNLNGISVWDYRSKNFLLSQSSSLHEVTSFAFNEKSTVLAVGDTKGNIRLFDTKTFFGIVNFNDAVSKITKIKFLKDNTLVASSLDGVVRAYDLGKYKLFREMKTLVNNQILALEVEQNGDIVIGAGVDPYEIYIWSLRTGMIIEVLSNHTSPVHLLQYANTKQVLLSASWDRSVKSFFVFSKNKTEEKIEMGDRITDLKLTKSERFFGVATMRNEIQFFLLDEMQLFSLIDVKAQFPDSTLTSFEISYDGKIAYIVGGINGIISVDIDHRCVTGKIAVTGNRDYKFNGEKMNSRSIMDGFETKKNYLSYQLETSKVILPGSVGIHAKELIKPVFTSTDICLSPEGDHIAVACSEGLVLFGKKSERHYWRISSEVDKDSLINLLKQEKFVEFFVTCLQLRMFSLLEVVVWDLSEEHVYSIVRSLTLDMFESLLEFLKQNIEKCKKIELVICWIRSLLIFRAKELSRIEVRPFVTFLVGFVNIRFEEFVNATEFNQELISFLKCQISN